MQDYSLRNVTACLRGKGWAAFIFASLAFVATPASAQSDPLVNTGPDPFGKNPEATAVIGKIILMRDVGPRNAHPARGGSAPHRADFAGCRNRSA